MNVELKPGSLSNFFSSAKETAKEIDEKRKVTKKKYNLNQKYRFFSPKILWRI